MPAFCGLGIKPIADTFAAVRTGFLYKCLLRIGSAPSRTSWRGPAQAPSFAAQESPPSSSSLPAKAFARRFSPLGVPDSGSDGVSDSGVEGVSEEGVETSDLSDEEESDEDGVDSLSPG